VAGAVGDGVFIVKDTPDNSINQEWTVIIGRTIASALDDGNYTFQFVANDVAGRRYSENIRITVDTKKPDATITNFTQRVERDLSGTPLNYVNGVVRFATQLADDSGIKESYYQLLPGTGSGIAWTPATLNQLDWDAFKTTGTALTATTDISTVALYNDTEVTYTNGKPYTLYVGAKDEAGNFIINKYPDDAADFSFYVLQSTDKPLITINNLAAGDFVEDTVSIRGTANDDDGFTGAGAVVVELSKDSTDGTDGTWDAATGTPKVSGTKDITFDVTLPAAYKADGTYWIRVTAADDPAKKVGADNKIRSSELNASMHFLNL
jgi:hypothetical protein